MRFYVSPVVRCSCFWRCCLAVWVVLWAGFAGLQMAVASNDGLNPEYCIRQDNLDDLEGRLAIRFSSAAMAGLDPVAGETVKTISAALSHRVITDLSDSNMDDLFTLDDDTSLSIVAPLKLQESDEGYTIISANLMIQKEGQDSVIELPLLMDGQLNIGNNQSYVFTVSTVSVPVTWVSTLQSVEKSDGRDSTEGALAWRGGEVRDNNNNSHPVPYHSHPMPYHSPHKLYIPFTPIPKPPLPKSSPLPESQGVFPEDSKQSPFSSSPKLDKPVDELEFGSDGVSFSPHHSPFS